MTLKFIARRAYWEGYAKALLAHLHNSDSNATVLSTEQALLRRILFRLMPQIMGRFFRRPHIALRQLWITVMVLSCVAAGYLRYKLISLSGQGQPYGT